MSNVSKQVLSDIIWEGTTPTLGFQIVNPAGVGFKPTTINLVLFDASTGTILRNEDVTVLVDANGNVAVTLTPDDTAIITSGIPTEVKRALFTWVWNAGTLFGAFEIEFAVEAHRHIPVPLP